MSVMTELLKRRVPQILGMYVAAVWLCVEIADWMSERFPVSAQFSSYVFVILLSLAPAVAILAWGHGKPGKDQWTKAQGAVVVLNVMLAFLAAWYLVKPTEEPMPNPPVVPPVSMTDTVLVADENSGEMLSFEVPKKGMSQRVSLSLWLNETGDESLNWLQEGASWLLSKDLNRTPLMAVQSPLESEGMRQAFQDKGYEDAVGEPLTLSLQVAQKRSAQWLVKGAIVKDQEDVSFKAELYDVLTGALVKTVTHRHANWLVALDSLSKELSDVILADHPTIRQQIPDLSIQDHVSADLTAIKAVVTALHAVAFDNDYTTAKQLLTEALSLDATLAEAYLLQTQMYAGSGEFVQAAEMARKALSYDHKLYGEDVFHVKAQLYGMTGEEDKALRVMENWTKVYPESIRAWLTLANNLMIKGNRLEDAAAAFEELQSIEPDSKHLLRLSNVHVLRSDFQAAVDVLNAYLQHHPESVAAILALGRVKMRQGRFDEAKSYFESAELMVNDDLTPELELAKIEMAVGDVAIAEGKLLSLLDRAKNDAEKLSVYMVLETLYNQMGRMKDAMALNETSEPIVKASLSPIVYLLTYHGKKMGYLTALGQQETVKELLLELEEKTQPPFSQLLVYMHLTYHSSHDNKAGLEKHLEQAKAVMKAFKMSIYQQFIDNYEAQINRLAGDYEKALALHEKAINEASQSILVFNSIQVLIELNRQKVKTLLAMGSYDEALVVLDAMAVYQPRSAENRALRIEVLQAKGDTVAAQQAVSEVEQLWSEVDEDYIEYQKFLELKANIQ